MPYRADIDGLRAIAIAVVLLFHVDAMPGGFIGVDVFFVISGYLITGIIQSQNEEGRFSFVAFYQRRARRLLPALMATVLATLVLSLLILSPYYLNRLGQSALFAVIPASNIFFFLDTGYFDTVTSVRPLLHTWSLAVEEQFYLIWPSLVFLALKIHSRRGLAALVVLAGGASFAANLLFLEDKQAIFYLTPFRVFEFALGAGVLLIEKRVSQWEKLQAGMVSLGLALILVSALTLSAAQTFPGPNAITTCLGACLAILGGKGRLGQRLLGSRAMAGIGRRSYSLYLVHWPVIVLFRYLKVGPITVFDTLLLIIATFVLGELSYRLVEQPFRQSKPGAGFRISGRVAAWTGSGAAAIVCLLAGFLWATNGIASRLTPDFMRAVEAVQTEQEGYFDLPPPVPFAQNDKVKVLVFGNSFGVDIYHGLVDFPTLDVHFSGSTHYDCYAFIVKSREPGPDCEGNLAMLKTVDVANADVVVMSDLWQVYRDPNIYVQALTRVVATIRTLNPDARIVLVGPRMVFYGRVLDHLIRLGTITDADRLVSPYYQYSIDYFRTFEADIKQWTEGAGVTYFGLIDALCADVCQVMTPDGKLIYVDDGHFSLAGARYVGQLFSASQGDPLQKPQN